MRTAFQGESQDRREADRMTNQSRSFFDDRFSGRRALSAYRRQVCVFPKVEWPYGMPISIEYFSAPRTLGFFFC